MWLHTSVLLVPCTHLTKESLPLWQHTLSSVILLICINLLSVSICFLTLGLQNCHKQQHWCIRLSIRLSIQANTITSCCHERDVMFQTFSIHQVQWLEIPFSIPKCVVHHNANPPATITGSNFKIIYTMFHILLKVQRSCNYSYYMNKELWVCYVNRGQTHFVQIHPLESPRSKNKTFRTYSLSFSITEFRQMFS